MMKSSLLVLIAAFCTSLASAASSPDAAAVETVKTACKSLLAGQYVCDKLPDVDPATQQPRGCNPASGRAPDALECRSAPGIVCDETGNATFYLDVACKRTNGYDFETALLLSIFLGMFGADRFYLGYPAIGLLKFSTLGFFFLGHLLDVILIASQTLKPADGSDYVINYFGPGITVLSTDNETYRRPEADWF